MTQIKKNNITVLQVYKYFLPDIGGVQVVMDDLLGTQSDDLSHTILTSRPRGFGGVSQHKGAKVIRTFSLGEVFATPLAPLFIFWFWWLARKHDVVHYHFPTPLIDLAVSLWFPKKTRLIVHWHLDIVAQKRAAKWLRPFTNRVLERADRIIVATPHHFNTTDWLTPYRDKCEVIPYGIDTDKLVNSVDPAKVEQLKRDYGEYFLFVGRLVAHKGADVLMKAAQGLKDCRVVVVGDGPQREALLKLRDELGLEDRVAFAGRVSDEDLACYFAACYAFVFPSTVENEAFGLVQLEAMAFGKPIINTRLNSGVTWVARDGKEAITVEPGDVEGLREGMERLLKNDALCDSMGFSGSRVVLEKFARVVFLSRCMDEYRGVSRCTN